MYISPFVFGKKGGKSHLLRQFVQYVNCRWVQLRIGLSKESDKAVASPVSDRLEREKDSRRGFAGKSKQARRPSACPYKGRERDSMRGGI